MVLIGRYQCVKLVTLAEGDPKASFSIATKPRCRGGRYSIPWIAPLYLIMLSVKQGGIKYHFGVFSMTRPEIEPRSAEPLANTLLIRPIARSLEGTVFANEPVDRGSIPGRVIPKTQQNGT